MKKVKHYSIWQKTFHTLSVLVLLRLFYSVPTPGVNTDYFKAMLENNASLGFLNAITGSGLSGLSVMALSVGPYITASIFIQLFGILIPKLGEMQNGMKEDRDKVDRITFILGILMAIVQSGFMAIGFGQRGLLLDYKWYWIVCVMSIWTLTSALTSLIGKTMGDKKSLFVGNGVSLILASNIIASYPKDIRSVMAILSYRGAKNQIWTGILLFTGVILLFIFTVYINGCEKQIKVVYSTKSGGGEGIIPIKLCTGGVVPVIFASSIISFPVMIAGFLGKSDLKWIRILDTGSWFQAGEPIYTLGVLLYLGLILAYSYFYTSITFNPTEVAHNIQKSGGTVPGIRAGTPTAVYLKKQMKYVIAVGAACMSVIAVAPIIASSRLGVSNVAFLGTSVIIIVSVVLDTKTQIQSQKRGNKYHKKGGRFYVA